MMRQCNEVQDNFAAYVDGQLEEEARALIQEHLAQCALCRDEVDAQAAIKRQLKALARRQSRVHPPARIWAGATREWNRIDGLRWRRYQLQFVFVGACILLMLFGAVWARLVIPNDFPELAAIRDFNGLNSGAVKPAYSTSDPDGAAKWLRDKLHTDLPPIDLSLSRAQLLGADVVPTSTLTLGRLLYRTPHGLLGVYVAPSGTRFADLKEATLEGDRFRVDVSHKGAGFYGWQAGNAGYALITSSPGEPGSTLLDAEHATQQPAD